MMHGEAFISSIKCEYPTFRITCIQGILSMLHLLNGLSRPQIFKSINANEFKLQIRQLSCLRRIEAQNELNDDWFYTIFVTNGHVLCKDHRTLSMYKKS